MKIFNILAGIALCVALPLQAAESTANTQESSATDASASAQASQTAVIYDRHGQPITAMQAGKARAAEEAVSKAGVPPDSTEAAMIRISMGQSPETAYEPNDGIYDAEGKPINSRQAAEDLAVVEVMRRGGVEPGSERDAQIRAAAKGEATTAEGEPVDEQTMEDVAKEIAVQQTILATGVQPGSPNESLIRMGADVMMEKFKSWR
ncbi:hypothetical protein [Zhongshania aliphaticivorans]|uniref:hypothetical protein n=1 Tax=Zhongshania aliphaticivorans TaxID=1470434 RepID=UPI0039C9497F